MQRSTLGPRLCRVQQRAKKSRYQSEVFVCVSTHCRDAVDRLLMSDVMEDCSHLEESKNKAIKSCPLDLKVSLMHNQPLFYGIIEFLGVLSRLAASVAILNI